MADDDQTAKLAEFNDLVRRDDRGENLFADIVRCGLQLLPFGRLGLALEFHVSDDVIDRWAKGLSDPGAILIRQVIDHLQRKVALLG